MSTDTKGMWEDVKCAHTGREDKGKKREQRREGKCREGMKGPGKEHVEGEKTLSGGKEEERWKCGRKK